MVGLCDGPGFAAAQERLEVALAFFGDGGVDLLPDQFGIAGVLYFPEDAHRLGELGVSQAAE